MVARQGPSMPPHSWPSSTNEAVHDGEYLVCDALRMVGAQPFIVTQAALPAHAAKALYERLDLRTFPSSLRNRADGPTHTLKTLLAFGFWLLAFGFWLLAFGFWLLAFGKVTLTQDTVEVETVTQFFSLKIVGVVSRPSPEAGGERLQTEWIVWVGDELKDGNYKAYRTLIVRPPSNSRGGRYTGTLYPKQ